MWEREVYYQNGMIAYDGEWKNDIFHGSGGCTDTMGRLSTMGSGDGELNGWEVLLLRWDALVLWRVEGRQVPWNWMQILGRSDAALQRGMGES